MSGKDGVVSQIINASLQLTQKLKVTSLEIFIQNHRFITYDYFQAARPLGPDGKPIPGPAEVRQIQAARKMAQQQAQVDEVIGIMHQNVENVLERDRKLGDLEERADALQDGCAQFEKQAAAMKNKFWMENLKAIIAGSVVGLIVLGE